VSKALVEIEGFKELSKKLIQLSDDKSKRKEVVKILGQLANPALKAARQLAPVSKKPHTISGGKRAKKTFQPGNLRKSLAKKTMRRAKNPTVYVSPRSRKNADGFYGRQFILKGTKKITANPFIDKAHKQTEGRVTADAERKMVKYIQKQIDKLS
jgi:HK97 gp10 family phage protein